MQIQKPLHQYTILLYSKSHKPETDHVKGTQWDPQHSVTHLKNGSECCRSFSGQMIIDLLIVMIGLSQAAPVYAILSIHIGKVVIL